MTLRKLPNKKNSYSKQSSNCNPTKPT